MAKPALTTAPTTATTTARTTKNTEDFQVNEFVLAQAPSATKGVWYAHYPAVIRNEFKETKVVCEWIDPENRWPESFQVISKNRLLHWNYENIDKVGRTEVPQEDKKYWEVCAVATNRRILGKICFSRSKDRDIL